MTGHCTPFKCLEKMFSLKCFVFNSQYFLPFRINAETGRDINTMLKSSVAVLFTTLILTYFLFFVGKCGMSQRGVSRI